MLNPRLLSLLLALSTLLIYLPAATHGFSIFDDDVYVYANPMVQAGLTWAGLKWAFVTWHTGNWHPVTWLSHMLDCELFGLNPGAHHFVNILWHAVNAALLFTLLWRWTGAQWPSLFVAALFAWHPLRVESVAWLAERKDVLSTFFEFLALFAYTKAVGRIQEQKNGLKLWRSRFYWLALLWFALGLMAKPMLVTLPLVMLLLDYWPLNRMTNGQAGIATLKQLVVEKLPFILLSLLSCVVTFLAQRHGGMVASLEQVTPGYRLANVPLAYMRYLGKIFWPEHLAIFYPMPETLSPVAVCGAVAVLAGVTIMVWLLRKSHPYILTGWLWFLVAMVPVIGVVQVGQAAMSDRYSYFPSIGIFVAMTFAAAHLAKRLQLKPIPLSVAAVLILGSCVLATENQLTFWRNDISLFSHALKVTRDNEPARLSLGLAYEVAGRKAEALAEYQAGQRLNPYRVKTYQNIARLLAESGQTNEAVAEYQAALQLNPQNETTHFQLAHLLAEAGRTNEALAEFEAARQCNPKDVAVLDSLGILLVTMNRFDEATGIFSEALRLEPASWQPLFLSGLARMKQGHHQEALTYFREALQKKPDNLDLLIYLAQVLASDEDPHVRSGQEAFQLASQAINLAPDQPAVLDTLAMAYAELGRFDEAEKTAQDCLRLMSTAGGRGGDLARIQQRLSLYQRHQPYRQSFTNLPMLEITKP